MGRRALALPELADTLDFDRHVALHVTPQMMSERHARMRAFVATVAEPELSERLREALSQQGGVQGFYAILTEHPQVGTRWQRVESPRVQELIEEWLRSEQLIVSNRSPWSD